MKHPFIIVLVCAAGSLFAQTPQDTLHTLPKYRNIIRFNPTPLILFGPHYYIFGYERVLNPKQSISFNAGFVQMPTIEPLDFDSLTVFDRGRKKYGASFAFDYRFYMLRRNKFKIPDGLYIGPYAGYYFFHNELEINSTDTAGFVTTSYRNSNLHIALIGFEVGYHIIVWKDRLSIDLLLLGPSVGLYNVKIDLANDVTLENDKLEAIRDAIYDEFPKLKDAVSDGSFTNTGSTYNIGIGFRYAIQIGFCF